MAEEVETEEEETEEKEGSTSPSWEDWIKGNGSTAINALLAGTLIKNNATAQATAAKKVSTNNVLSKPLSSMSTGTMLMIGGAVLVAFFLLKD